MHRFGSTLIHAIVVWGIPAAPVLDRGHLLPAAAHAAGNRPAQGGERREGPRLKSPRPIRSHDGADARAHCAWRTVRGVCSAVPGRAGDGQLWHRRHRVVVCLRRARQFMRCSARCRSAHADRGDGGRSERALSAPIWPFACSTPSGRGRTLPTAARRLGRQFCGADVRVFPTQAVSVVLLGAAFLVACVNPNVGLSPWKWPERCCGSWRSAGNRWRTPSWRRLKGMRRRVAGCVTWGRYYSRHPNYFFEWLVWVAYFALRARLSVGWVAIIGPARHPFLPAPARNRNTHHRGTEPSQPRRRLSSLPGDHECVCAVVSKEVASTSITEGSRPRLLATRYSPPATSMPDALLEKNLLARPAHPRGHPPAAGPARPGGTLATRGAGRAVVRLRGRPPDAPDRRGHAGGERAALRGADAVLPILPGRILKIPAVSTPPAPRRSTRPRRPCSPSMPNARGSPMARPSSSSLRLGFVLVTSRKISRSSITGISNSRTQKNSSWPARARVDQPADHHVRHERLCA